MVSLYSMPKITKAIITAAGYGTRFLPATKVIPKEMLPLIDRPIIQALAEEAVESGITKVVIVTRPGAEMTKQHFAPYTSLEDHLKSQGKTEQINRLKAISQMAEFSFIDQNPDFPYGTGAPLLSARDYLEEGEFFVLMFGDDLVKAQKPAVRQLIELWEKQPSAVILATQEVPESQVSRYGIIKFKEGSEEVEDLVEKPDPGSAPSRLASFGRFILNQGIVKILEEQIRQPMDGKEFYLTDAISTYAKKNPVLALPIEGKWLTTGDPLNWLKANVEFALEREDIGREFSDYLKELL